MRRFELFLVRSSYNTDGVNWERHDAISSGVKLAEGAEFTDGTAVVRWCGNNPSTVLWPSMEALRIIDHAPEYDDDRGYRKGDRAILWLDCEEHLGEEGERGGDRDE